MIIFDLFRLENLLNVVQYFVILKEFVVAIEIMKSVQTADIKSFQV